MWGEAPLPEFAVRRSPRARRVRLTVTARDGLVVTLPEGAPMRLAEEAVAARRAWAERHLAAVAPRRAVLLAGPDALLPHEVALRAAGETWPVEYEHARSATSARARGACVAVRGDVDDARACVAALRRWRDRVAAELLPALVALEAERFGVGAPPVRLRTQRTRWGSCSTRGGVSLNRNLVFLPRELVEYVIAHELAHLAHANHSAAFWAHLEGMVPGAPDLRARLREAHGYVPAWAEP